MTGCVYLPTWRQEQSTVWCQKSSFPSWSCCGVVVVCLDQKDIAFGWSIFWWCNFFEAGIEYFFMVQHNVSGRCTFTKEFPLLRVEEAEFSLRIAPRVKKWMPLALNPILHVVVIYSRCKLPFCDQAFSTINVLQCLWEWWRGARRWQNKLAEAVRYVA